MMISDVPPRITLVLKYTGGLTDSSWGIYARAEGDNVEETIDCLVVGGFDSIPDALFGLARCLSAAFDPEIVFREGRN